MEEVKKHEGPVNAQRPENGASTRTFTQEEVNKIVSERLAKERAKAAEHSQAAQNAQEAALLAAESRLSCLTYLRTQGLPEELLDILDTADPKKFQAQTNQLLELCPSLDARTSPPPTFSLGSQGRRDEFGADPFAAAFGRK